MQAQEQKEMKFTDLRAHRAHWRGLLAAAVRAWALFWPDLLSKAGECLSHLGRFHHSKQSQSCVSGIDAKACIMHTMAEMDFATGLCSQSLQPEVWDTRRNRYKSYFWHNLSSSSCIKMKPLKVHLARMTSSVIVVQINIVLVNFHHFKMCHEGYQ